MKKFVAIIGDTVSGKSTLIKSLTGCCSGNFRGQVKNKLNNKFIEVIAESPQDKSLTRQEFVETLERVVTSEKCIGIVCALKPTQPSKRLSIESVLSEAVKYKYQTYIYIINPGYLGFTCSAKNLYDRIPLGVEGVYFLDGRNFALDNAGFINKTSQLLA